jgi:hypothetical protein
MVEPSSYDKVGAAYPDEEGREWDIAGGSLIVRAAQSGSAHGQPVPQQAKALE